MIIGIKITKTILFDSRIDKKTLVMYHDEETDKNYPRVEAGDHYTVADWDGNYLDHFTKPGEDESGGDSESSCDEEAVVTGENVDVEGNGSRPDEGQQSVKKTAEAVAHILWDLLVAHGMDKSVAHLAIDSTTSNTGWKSGILARCATDLSIP